MYTWGRAGDVAAKCLLSGFAGAFLGMLVWFGINVVHSLMGVPVDPMFVYVISHQEGM